MPNLCRLLASAAFIGGLFGVARANEDRPADFTIGTTVLASGLEPFGANLTYPDTNNFTSDPSFEPFNLRLRGNATGGGPNTILNEANATTTYWDTIADGFFNGATVRVYRVVFGAVQHVRTDTIQQYWASTANGLRIELATNGPDVQAGDIYFIEMDTNAPPSHLAHSRLPWIPYWDTWRYLVDYQSQPISGLVRDPSTVPPGGGRTSLRLTATGPQEVQISQYRYGWPGFVYEPLVPGRTYRVSVWLRQQGLTSGQVRFWFTSEYSALQHTFSGVDGTWRQYTWDFVAPPYPRENTAIVEHVLGFTGPGQVWVDEFLIYDPAQPALGLNAPALQALHDFDGGALRLWSGQTNTEWGTSLDSWTSREGQSKNTWAANNGRTTGPSVNLPLGLSICEQTDMTPWLIVGPYFNEQELLGLMEFLAGPSGSTWGARRGQTGRAAPWTDAFGKIRIEFANEAWNFMFDPWSFDAATYGAFAERCFSTMKSSPYFAAVADRFDFVLNGWVASTGTDGYGATARRNSPSADFVDITAYTGGWELGGTIGGGTVTDEGFLDTLTFMPRVHQVFVDAQMATRRQLALEGFPYDLAVYEGGPGYGLPNPGEPFNLVQEAYGKSLANAVATLDCFLYGAANGFGPQVYFHMAPGYNWTSHTYPSNGYRPHASWLALQLHNLHAAGDPVLVAANTIPTRDFAATEVLPASTEVPMATAYAYRSGNQYAVFVLSRRLTGTTPVTLRLPFSAATSVTRHRLTGGPTDTNNASNLIAIESSPVVGFNPVFQFDLPPAGIVCYVFDGVTMLPEGEVRATINQGPTQDDPTSYPLIRFRTVFTHPVTGFEPSDIVLSGTAGATDVEIIERAPFTGSVFDVHVTGMTQAGTVRVSLPAGRVQAAGGLGNLAATSWDDTVNFQLPVAEDRLFLYDGFELLPREAPNPTFLDGVASGFGFGQPWMVQNFNPADAQGYRLRSEQPMRIPGLLSRGSYAEGGYVFVTSGRAVDVSAFGLHQALGSNPPQIGQTGLTLWSSGVLRKTSANNEPVFFMFNAGPYAQGWNDIRVMVGYFGEPSNHQGTRYWTLAIRNPENTDFVYARTNVPMVPGQQALWVLQMRFGSTDEISLYMNPASLGGQPPAQADAVLTSDRFGTNLVFRTMGFYGGNSLAQGHGDELRIGDTYASVTPQGSHVAGSVVLREHPATDADIPIQVEVRDGGGTLVDSERVPLRANGTFDFVTPAIGSHRLSVKASHWLRRRLDGQMLSPSGSLTANFELFNGDVNGDNSVNIADFLALRAAFGSSAGQSQWNANADLNGDGSVNVTDFLILRANLGRTGDAP